MRVVLVNCFDTYGERVEMVRKYFMSKGHEVQLILSDYKHLEKVRNDETPKDGYTYIHVPAYYKNLSVARLKSHIIFSKKVVKEAEKLKPEMIYVLVPPNSLVKEFSLYKNRNTQVKLIYDVIDMWPETMPIPFFKRHFPFSLWKGLRDKYISLSDYVITECDLYQKFLTNSANIDKLSTIHLTRRNSREVVRDYISRETMDVCYLGSINNIVDINIICSILMQLSAEYKVIFHIIGKGEKKAKLIHKVSQTNVQIIDHGIVYEKSRKMDIFSQCDFGLNIMKKSVCVGLTMKSIDYFEAGLPVINNIQGDTFEYVAAYGIGVNLNKKGEIDLEKIKILKKTMNIVREKVLWLYNSEFSQDVFVQKMDKIYQTVMGGKTCKRE